MLCPGLGGLRTYKTLGPHLAAQPPSPPPSPGDRLLHADLQPRASRAPWPGQACRSECQVSVIWTCASWASPMGMAGPSEVGEGAGQCQDKSKGLDPAQPGLGQISAPLLSARKGSLFEDLHLGGICRIIHIQSLPSHSPLSSSPFLATSGQEEPPPPSSPEILALPPGIRPQVQGAVLGPLPRWWEGMGKKPASCLAPLSPWMMRGPGEGALRLPAVSAEKEEAG